MSEAADPVETYRMSILDHLRELRTRLVIAMWACLVCVVVAFFFSEQLYDWISAPMVAALVERGEGTMAITDPLEGVFTYLQVSVIAGSSRPRPWCSRRSGCLWRRGSMPPSVRSCCPW
jgi:sec-independent protein translocase protein TatC